MIYPTIQRLREYVQDEVTQRRQEGCDVSTIAPRVAEAPDDADYLLTLYRELTALRAREGFPYEEPEDLAAIQAARPADQPLADATPPAVDDALADRIYGAWLGRCAGLMLGKPFECPPFGNRRGALTAYLRAADAYPLDDYAPNHAAALGAAGRDHLPFPATHRGNVQHVIADDDIHYTIMGLEVLEASGAAFTTADVAHWWMRKLVPTTVFTAEEAAYRNLIQLGLHFEPHKATAEDWQQVRSWLNPWREFIGAQIRADGWAYACPGRVVQAAEFAYRDATLSHEKNGAYGEMFCAAMIAAAAICDDPHTIVQAGLGQIPRRSRLADAIQRTVEKCDALDDNPDRFEELSAWLWDELGEYHVVHTINNAAAVVAALLLGGHDFERVISTAVMCGWDTDCNGATAGSICGMMRGARHLPEKWIAPLNDTLRVDVHGFNPIAISTCAERHMAIVRRL